MSATEAAILTACADRKLSKDEAFEEFYRMYAPTVLSWLTLRVARPSVDDLMQDVWTIFFQRWQRWEHLPEMEAPEAKPVLSFLFRTVQFVTKAHWRTTHADDPLEGVDAADTNLTPERIIRHVEFGRCLEKARALCAPEEFDILIAKIAGVPAREIARTLGITEPMVDHKFRNVVARLQEELDA
jgi:DNA-directed RNA polymerase specialized sigma24 family protein